MTPTFADLMLDFDCQLERDRQAQAHADNAAVWERFAKAGRHGPDCECALCAGQAEM